jgi:hypothetical protein
MEIIMVALSDLKNISMSNAYKIYTSALFQLFIFLFTVGAAFVLGMISQIGYFFIPLIDKDELLSSIFLYAIIALTSFAMLRTVLIALVMDIVSAVHQVKKGTIIDKIFSVILILFIITAAALLFLILRIVFIDTIPNNLYFIIYVVLGMIAFSVFLIFNWYIRNRKSDIFFFIFAWLGIATLCGTLIVDFQKEKDPSFEIKIKGSQPFNGNILLKSSTGIITYDRDANSTEFYPWTEVKSIKLTKDKIEFLKKMTYTEKSLLISY